MKSFPEFVFIFNAIGLDLYKESTLTTLEFLETYFGISPLRGKYFLDVAMRVNLIVEVHGGKHKKHSFDTQGTGAIFSINTIAKIGKYHTILGQKLLEKMMVGERMSEQSRLASISFNSNEESMRLAGKELMKCLERIQLISKNDTEKSDRVGVLNLHLFDNIGLKENDVSIET